jgi:hexosaminidase
MRATLLSLFFLGWATHIFAQTFGASVENMPISIVPQPVNISPSDGVFSLNNRTQIVVPSGDAGFRRVAQLLTERLKIDGTKLSIVDINASKSTNNVVFFIKMDKSEMGTEGYKLTVTPQQINISAATEQGAFYAMQTLLQLLPSDIFSAKTLKKANWKVPCVTIDDNPRYAYRGLHLDVARHFFPVSFVKKYIDMLAMHKMNTFHWHLTDDQGWRIEIKKYPKLTEIGGFRRETLIGHASNKPEKFDGQRYGGFYTQAEIKEVVAYASAHFVTIIPEIEMPGHALAALSAYPELGCEPTKNYQTATKWGVFDDVFCPSETTFSFLQDVLTEVMDLFPSKYIHIGGDECPKTAWKKSAFCQELIKKEGLKDEDALQSYFIRRIEKFVNSKGKNIIGWDEILEGGLAPNATVMSWRGTEGGIAAAKEKHDVIMTPGTHCYLDHYQAEPESEPLAIGGLTTLEKMYSYEPTPDVLSDEEARHILGAQGNVWTEYMVNSSYVEYMVFPRAIALSEVLWSPKSSRNYADFISRLTPHLKRFDRLNVNYAKRFFDVKSALIIENSDPSVQLTSAAKNSDIRYSLDGYEPKISSPIYTQPIVIQKVTTVKTAVFQNGKMIGKSTTSTFYPHSCLGRKYELKDAPKNTYESGKFGLTNGIRGTENSYGQWTGFEGKDMEFMIDFGEPRPFQQVKIQFLNKPSSWIFLPDFVTVSVSNDGVDWRDIDRADFAHSRSLKNSNIREATMRFSEFTKPKRFIKVLAKNIGTCPKGHEGEGSPAWLFADEIIIE